MSPPATTANSRRTPAEPRWPPATAGRRPRRHSRRNGPGRVGLAGGELARPAEAVGADGHPAVVGVALTVGLPEGRARPRSRPPHGRRRDIPAAAKRAVPVLLREADVEARRGAPDEALPGEPAAVFG